MRISETKFNFPFYRVHWNKLVQEHVWSSFFLRHCLQGCALRFVCTIMHQLHQDFRPDLLSHLDISSCQRFSVCNKSKIRSERSHHGNSVRNSSSFIFFEGSLNPREATQPPSRRFSLSLSLSHHANPSSDSKCFPATRQLLIPGSTSFHSF